MSDRKLKYDTMMPIALDGGAIGISVLTDEDRILELRQYLINGLIREGWNASDAEDWAHDILELAIRYKNQLRNPESFMGWIRAIKTNLLRNRYKRRKREEEALGEATDSCVLMGDYGHNPESDFEGRLGVPEKNFYKAGTSEGLNILSKSLFAQIPQLFNGMGDRMRQVFICRVVLEYSTQETMDLLELTENVVKKDLMKALDKVKMTWLQIEPKPTL